MDLLVFFLINGFAGWWPALDWIMVLAAESAPVLGALVFCLLWWWPGLRRHQRRKAAVLALMAVLTALGATTLPPLFYYRPRPFETHDVTLLLRSMPQASFPSAHAAAASAIATALGLLPSAAGWAGWAVATVTATARVYVGVHYPSDVLAGLMIGWGSAAVIRYNADLLDAFAARIVAGIEELL